MSGVWDATKDVAGKVWDNTGGYLLDLPGKALDEGKSLLGYQDDAEIQKTVDLNSPEAKAAYYDTDRIDNRQVQAQDLLNAAQNRTAPQIDSASTARGSQANVAQLNPAEQGKAYTASMARANNTNINPVNTLGNPNQFNTSQIAVNPNTIVDTNKFNVSAAQLGDADAQFRNNQLNLANQLSSQAQGNGPSLADYQMQKNLAAAQAANLSAAASQRGYGNTASGARQLLLQQSAAGQQAAADTAALKIQEQLAAQDRLGQISSQGRSQDINVATTQANLQQQANLSNQGAGLQLQGQNTNVLMQVAQLNQQRDLANQQLSAAIAQGDQAAINQYTAMKAGLDQQITLANQSAQLDTNQFNAAGKNTMTSQNLAAANQFNLAQYEAQNNMSQFNQSQEQAIRQFNAQQEQQVKMANLEASLKSQGLSSSEISNYLALQAQLDQQAQANEQKYWQDKIAQEAAYNGVTLNQQASNAAITGGVIQGGAMLGAAALAFSDKKLKENINKDNKDKLSEFLNSVKIEWNI